MEAILRSSIGVDDPVISRFGRAARFRAEFRRDAVSFCPKQGLYLGMGELSEYGKTSQTASCHPVAKTIVPI